MLFTPSPSKPWLSLKHDVAVLSLKVQSGKDENCLIEQDPLLILRLKAIREHGKANQALVKFIAKTFGCTQKEVVILRGALLPYKTVSLPITKKLLSFISE